MGRTLITARRLVRDICALPTYEQVWEHITNGGEDDHGFALLCQAVVDDKGDDVVNESAGLLVLTGVLEQLRDHMTTDEGRAALKRADLYVEDIVLKMLEHSREVGFNLGLAVGLAWEDTSPAKLSSCRQEV